MLTAYHSNKPSWRSSAELVGNFVGLEIETNNAKGNRVTSQHLDKAALSYDNKEILCETDGSLNEVTGCEIITPPIALKDAISPEGVVSSLVNVLANSGCDLKPQPWHGLHLNININKWDSVQADLTVFALFLLKRLCIKVGGRDSRETHFTSHINCVGKSKFQLVHPSKRRAAWVRPNLPVMEVRYPLAVLDYGIVKRNISFVYSVKSFIDTKAARFALGYLYQILNEEGEFVHGEASRNFRGAGYGGHKVQVENAKAVDLIESLYLTWLSLQKNYSNLFLFLTGNNEYNDLDLNNEEFEKTSSIEEALGSVRRFGPAVQKQAVQWGREFAESSPKPKAVKKPAAKRPAVPGIR